MADNTSIEWTDSTWNPITGCTVVSLGCTNCYAMRLAGTRLRHHPSRAGLTTDSKSGPVWNGVVRLNERWLDQPLRWRRPRKIFVCAHGDLFHESVPDKWIDSVFAIMAQAPQHVFQVLTKRADRMRDYVTKLPARRGMFDCHSGLDWCDWPLPNVWLGVSVENQTFANERIPHLLATPAAVRFVSAEPLLGPVDMSAYVADCHKFCIHGCTASGDDECHKHLPFLDWVIVGGESGPGARPMHPDWARSIRDQCEAADVPFYFKQHGAWQTFYDRDHDDPDCRSAPIVDDRSTRFLNIEGGHGFHGARVVAVRNVGKKRAGRLLDGVEHNGMPEARSC